ncbi:hypothetical protein [Bacillus sp. Marseille-P3661]|uniref:hypothetical protein n=1 Tax=Bacillus sp. Marseille-P3661 TaxID=1936234 RepID=UPI000C83A686|nr:hypothetical protein [Bacillus sp. Marseille-P3661]
MTSIFYQAKAGDGNKKKGLKRTNSFFKTPQEAVSEALALKEKMDSTYKNEIQWDYEGKITGTSEKMKILRGYLGGDRKSEPFYLQILTVKPQDKMSAISPIQPKSVTSNDEKIINKVLQLLNK